MCVVCRADHARHGPVRAPLRLRGLLQSSRGSIGETPGRRAREAQKRDPAARPERGAPGPRLSLVTFCVFSELYFECSFVVCPCPISVYVPPRHMALPATRAPTRTYRQTVSARGALAHHWQVGRMVRRRAEGGQWERQQTGVRESGCDGSKGGRGPHAAPGLASGGHHASVRLGGIRLCLGVRLPACRGGVAGIRLEHSRGLVRAPHPSDELPVVVRDKVRLQGRRREVMGAPRPHGVWLGEGGRRALAAPGSMSTYMDDPLGSVGSGTTATSTLSGTRITPLTCRARRGGGLRVPACVCV